jgi:uncharacterized protein DUF6766
VRWVRSSSLSLAFGAIFLAALVGQALTGHAEFNHEAIAHGGDPISLGRYVTSSSFAVDVMENWQSEYLQFALYIFATVWFIQRGSTESKKPGEEGPGSDPTRRRYSWWYENSLVLVMMAIFLLSWAAMAVTGRVDYNAQQLDHQEAALTLWQYVGSSDFWNRTLQNWQSEFLAVGSMAALSIYLRQRGSSESKPVGAPDEQTGTETG